MFRGQAGVWSWLRLCCSALGLYSLLVLPLERQGRPCLYWEAGLGPGGLCCSGVVLGYGWDVGLGTVITVGPMLCWDLQCVDLAVLEASLELRGISA